MRKFLFPNTQVIMHTEGGGEIDVTDWLTMGVNVFPKPEKVNLLRPKKLSKAERKRRNRKG